MLRLIQAEFLKLRRKKFIVLMLLSALFMPLLAVFYFRSADKTVIEPLQFYKWTTFSYTAWIILPVVLGLVSTMLMYDENQNDMLKQLWIIPISKTGYFFSKFIVVDMAALGGAAMSYKPHQQILTFFDLSKKARPPPGIFLPLDMNY